MDILRAMQIFSLQKRAVHGISLPRQEVDTAGQTVIHKIQILTFLTSSQMSL
ncbi:hypothetical protein SDC9_24183 [bioreactor metagenome]|uniref:Uncharacterized protein n=1 Tax=bioreactor metagenome TaxID=1076179 RepID=A0A644UHG2_9ZZZZ